MERDLVVGLDGGTGGMRAFVFDRAGLVVGAGECAYETAYPAPGWAEQLPRDWLAAAAGSVRRALEGLDTGRVAALCAATTSCTVVCCSHDGSALAPAILWMDVRAGGEARTIRDRTGQALSAESFLCKALWYRENAPELWRHTEVLCEYQDYLVRFLTGEWCFSVNTACNWGYHCRRGGFDDGFYEAAGLGDALEKLPPRAVRVGEAAGVLCCEAAGALGLEPGLPVVQGGIDSSLGMLGMGVAGPGGVALMTGSSNLAMAVTRRPLFIAEDAVNSGPDFLLEGYYTSVQGQAASGSVLKWFRREFCRDLGEEAFRLLDREAAQVPPGSGGVLVQECWQGKRWPYNDPDARGAIVGLTMSATRGQMFRAVMEGVACGTQELLQAFTDKGQAPAAVHISGGTTRSELFLQIHADVSGIPFRVTSDYSPALGAGIAAAWAADWYPSLEAAAGGMVQFRRTVMPDRVNHEAYQAVLHAYKNLYAGLRAALNYENER